DIIFSEPQLNPAKQVYDRVSADGVSGPIAKTLESYKERMDADKALGAAMAKYSDKLVAGSFHNSTLNAHWPPETDFCRDLIFKSSPAGKQWDHEEVLLAVRDPYQVYMPQALTSTFTTVLQEKEKAVREKVGAPKNKNEEVELQSQISQELNETCNTILT